VNLSPVQLREVDLCQTVSAALARSGLSADRLELEITETMLLRNQVITGMRRCGSFGRLAFELQWMISAPGISSLSTLEDFFDRSNQDRPLLRP
jgi:predicted signal transduction protein with EAL and GGDEF domain